MSGSYEDMIYREHPTSVKHPRMRRGERAAQFSPFAALTGHEEALKETQRLTDHMHEMTEEKKAELDGRLQYLRCHQEEEQEVSIQYFQPDERKEGGRYRNCTGRIRRIDFEKRIIRMEDGTIIPAEYVKSISGDLFAEEEK